MKKISFISLLVLTIPLAQAQRTGWFTNFDISAGIFSGYPNAKHMFTDLKGMSQISANGIYKLSNFIGVGTGLTYSKYSFHFSEDYNKVGTNSLKSFNQNLTYFKIPLFLNIEVGAHRKVTMFVNLGVQPIVLLNAQITSNYYTYYGQIIPIGKNNSNFQPLGLGLMFSNGFNFNISKHNSILLAWQLDNTFTLASQNNTVWIETFNSNLALFSLKLGFQHHFVKKMIKKQ